MGKLTALQVQRAKPGRHGDGDGLFLHVRPEGSRSWVLRVQVNGKRRDLGLGSTLSLTEARDKAREWRKLAKEGKPVPPKVQRDIPTFEAAAREYHELNKGGWKNAKHAAQWISTLEAYAFPTLGRLTVDLIDAPLMWAALGAIWQEKPETARRVRQRIGTVLDYAKAHGWRDTEAPMRALARIVSPQTKQAGNFAAMPYRQLPAFMAKLRASESTLGKLALQFQILNASRSGEVRGARWGEIDFERKEWIIPAERMKAKKLHIVPLSPASLAVLEEVAGLFRPKPDDLIFPGLRGKQLSDMTIAKAFKVAGGGAYTVHGTARSGFRDWAAEMCPTVPNDVVEKALAHGVKDKTEAAYRRATYLEQRRPLMASWADYLAGASNVVRLAAG